MGDIAVLGAVVIAFALVSGRLDGTSITGPMVFVAAGLILGPDALGLLKADVDSEGVKILAEATLVIILFADATRIDVPALRGSVGLPGRLLLIGMPLTIALGTLVGLVIYSDLSLWHAALAATVLAPTDAALGRAVVSDKAVPSRIRQALNVESGLNDGLAVPLVTIFLVLAEVESKASETLIDGFLLIVEEVGLGLVVGIAVGFTSGFLLRKACERHWVNGLYRQLLPLAVAATCFAGASVIHGNGFIAAFVGGLAFRHGAQQHSKGAQDFAEDEGELLTFLTFTLFGAVMVGPRLGDLDWQILLYSVLSLTMVRMLPVAISLIGSGLRLQSVVFLGWFGPRGLASIVLGLTVLEELDDATGDRVFTVVVFTVLLSVFAHGITAAPWAGLFGRKTRDAAEAEEAMPEMVSVPELPIR
jgi:NhaP-type Na+/H+ or K+/H+ antiporter